MFRSAFLSLGVAGSALVLQTSEPEPLIEVPEGKSLFVIEYDPGPEWEEGKPVFEQDLQAHGGYMFGLQEEGTLLLGGPYLDDTGGLVLMLADDLDAAKEVLASDPAIEEGVFSGEVHPYYPAFNVDQSLM